MKILFLILIIFSNSLAYSQSYTYEDIYKSNNMYFFGYDFTHFKHVEANRMGQGEKMKGFIFELIALLNENKTVDNYKLMFKKDSVSFDFKSVNLLNSKINPEQILDSYTKHSIPKDSLQFIIDQYDTQGKSGIGFVQVIECFYKPKKQTSIWFVFFDISSKRILDAYETINNDADSYHGLAAYWGVGVSSGLGFYLSDRYKPELKKYKKKTG